jgi:shikimate kinase
MGAGKSTIGRLLAARLHVPYVDSDAIIVSNTGVSISTIFEIEGETGFRIRETRVIAELSAKSGCVVLSTGGGAVLDPANRVHLRNMGEVIYLDVGVSEQLKRIHKDRSRPLLRGTENDNVYERLTAMAEHRNHLYQEVAHWRIRCDGLQSKQVLSKIMYHLKQHQQRR